MNDATQAVRACWVVSSNDWKILFNVGPRFLQNWIISKNWQFACWYYQQCHPPSPSAIARAGVTWILSMKVCLFEQVTATPSISLRNLSIDGWDEGGWTLSIDYDGWQLTMQLRCRWMNPPIDYDNVTMWQFAWVGGAGGWKSAPAAWGCHPVRALILPLLCGVHHTQAEHCWQVALGVWRVTQVGCHVGVALLKLWSSPCLAIHPCLAICIIRGQESGGGWHQRGLMSPNLGPGPKICYLGMLADGIVGFNEVEPLLLKPLAGHSAAIWPQDLCYIALLYETITAPLA